MFTYLKSLYQPSYLKLLAAALVIFSARLWLIHNFGSSVPFWDSWDMQASVSFLPWIDGTLKWDDLLAAHAEHRIVFIRLLSLLLLILNETQWDPLLEMIVNALLSTTIAITLIVILKNKLEPAVQNWLLLSIILLWSLPYGWENILFGYFNHYSLMMLFSAIAAWGLLLNNNFSWKWWLGAICALAAYFNVASGFFMSVVIIILKLYLIAIDKSNRRSHLPTLLIGALITVIAVILLVKVPGTAVLKAHSVTDFLLTFGKSLAWPWVTYPWLSLILYLPLLALVLRVVWLRRYPSPAELFILALGGLVILQAASMGYARSAGGSSPSSRYMDILVFGVVVNLFAFYFITQPWYGLTCRIKPIFHVFTCFWQVLVVIGLGGLTVLGSWPAIQQKHFQGVEQLKNTREFIRTGQISALQNKPFLHIPYPDPNRLAYLLANPKLRRILPHTLTVPPLLQSEQPNSSFIVDGFYPSTGKYQNEITLGSYNSAGNSAIGRFESTSLQYQHSFLEIPVAGYLGEKDLTLQLVIEGQANSIMVTPPRLAKESWVSCYVRTPNRPFKLVAIDNNPNSWFAFAMPRSLGWLSFISIWVLEQSRTLLILSLFLLGMIFCLPISINHLSRDEF
ncbi:MAG: hypothetical protein HC877_20815 [Thioploca sp.]|nr:hypothetical protein [Thioploca sp.]